MKFPDNGFLKAAAAMGCVVSGLCLVAPAHASCTPSDPFGFNSYNVCPEGFAFAFTQTFDNLNHVRGTLMHGDPVQPGVPGPILQSIEGFYTGVQVSGGMTRVTSTQGETVIQTTKPAK